MYLLYKLERAGAEAVVHSLARNLDRGRFSPIVCALKGGGMADDFRSLGVPVRILGKAGRMDLGPLLHLATMIRRERVGIVHTHAYSPGLWGRLAGIAAGRVALVHTEHTLSDGKSTVQRWTDRWLESRTDCIVAVSMAVKRSLVGCCRIPEERVRVVYNGVDRRVEGAGTTAAERQELKRSLGLPPGCSVVATIGRLEPPKGHVHLLHAAARLAGEHVSTRFLLVGEGALRRDLEALAAKLGLGDRVLFAGFRRDVDRVLSIADVCAVPSIREGFSVTILEAMAAGKPVVATDVGGNSEAVESGVTGWIVPPARPDALADALGRLLVREEEARAFGAQARERFEKRFTQQRMVQETEKLYIACMESRRRASRRG